MPEIASVSATLTRLPGQTGEQPREQWAVLLACSTSLTQFASHRGLAPPAPKGLSLKHRLKKYHGGEFMLTGCNPDPEGPSEVCDLAPGQVGRLQGWTSLGFSLYLRTVGPWPDPRALVFSSGKGPFLPWNEITGLGDEEAPSTQQVPPGARHGGSHVLLPLPFHSSVHPPRPLPSGQEVLPVIQSASEESPRPATALLHCSLSS